MTAQEFNAATTNRREQAQLVSFRDALPDLGPGVDPTPQDLQIAAQIYSLLSATERRQFVVSTRQAATARIQTLNTEFNAL